jgi:hypothetical protein
MGQMFLASSPLFGILLSALFLGESITAIQLVAVVCLGGSLVMVFRDRHEHQHHHDESDHEHSHRHDHRISKTQILTRPARFPRVGNLLRKKFAVF